MKLKFTPHASMMIEAEYAPALRDIKRKDKQARKRKQASDKRRVRQQQTAK